MFWAYCVCIEGVIGNKTAKRYEHAKGRSHQNETESAHKKTLKTNVTIPISKHKILYTQFPATLGEINKFCSWFLFVQFILSAQLLLEKKTAMQ